MKKQLIEALNKNFAEKTPLIKMNYIDAKTNECVEELIVTAEMMRWDNMTELEKKTIASLVTNIKDIPDAKKEYLLGYAEAVADMKKKEE